eukprot:s2509_g11.t5
MWQSRNAAPRVEVPRPVQLGSLKSENEGQDPGIRLVPAGGGGWGRPKEDVEEPEEKPTNPRVGLTSQPAQLRPTAWGRTSISAQAGPRPAPWAQPAPGTAWQEPVEKKQEEFPSLGSEPKGRRNSGSGSLSLGLKLLSSPSRAVPLPPRAHCGRCVLHRVWSGAGPDGHFVAAATATAVAVERCRSPVRRKPVQSQGPGALRAERRSSQTKTRGASRARRYTSVDWVANLRGLWSSNLLRRILSPVLCTTGVAVLVCLAHAYLIPKGKFWHASTTGHALLVSALGLLLVFRTNTAYSRFWEGRQIWQRILDLGRDVSRYAILFRTEMGPKTSAHVCRLVQAFPYCMIEHLRGKKDRAMRSKLERLIGAKGELASNVQHDYTLPMSSNRPLFIVNQLAHAVRSVPNGEGPQAMYTNRERSQLMQNLEKLSSTIGACERLVQTPVPLSYVRHTSRFLSLFMLTLPFALVDVLGPYTVPVTCFASWALFGIFEIGLVIEDPFQGVLKVEVIADTLQVDIEESIRSLGAQEPLALLYQLATRLHDANSYESSRALPSTGEEISVARAAAQAESEEGRERSGDLRARDEPVLPWARVKEQVLLQIFQSYDVNGDQAIDKTEMERVLSDTAPDMEIDVESIEAIFEEADVDHDGLLTQAEWVKWAERWVQKAEIANLVLRMPSSPLLPADTQDDTWEEEENDPERSAEAEENSPQTAGEGEPSGENAETEPRAAVRWEPTVPRLEPKRKNRELAQERLHLATSLDRLEPQYPPQRSVLFCLLHQHLRPRLLLNDAQRMRTAIRPWKSARQPLRSLHLQRLRPSAHALLAKTATRYVSHFCGRDSVEDLPCPIVQAMFGRCWATLRNLRVAVQPLARTQASSFARFSTLTALPALPGAQRLTKGHPLLALKEERFLSSPFVVRPPLPVGTLLQRREVSTKIRGRFKMNKHRYLKNVKRVRYISAIPQYTGPLGRQTKKRAIIKDYRKTPRLREFMKTLADKRRAEKKDEEEERSRQQFARAQAVLFQEDLSVLLLAAVSQQPHVSSSSSRYKKVVRASAKCQARTH